MVCIKLSQKIVLFVGFGDLFVFFGIVESHTWTLILYMINKMYIDVASDVFCHIFLLQNDETI